MPFFVFNQFRSADVPLFRNLVQSKVRNELPATRMLLADNPLQHSIAVCGWVGQGDIALLIMSSWPVAELYRTLTYFPHDFHATFHFSRDIPDVHVSEFNSFAVLGCASLTLTIKFTHDVRCI